MNEQSTPWLTAKEAAERLRIHRTTLYLEVRAGRCRAARIAGRRSLRFLPEWLDEYLTRTTDIVPVLPGARRPHGEPRVATDNWGLQVDGLPKTCGNIARRKYGAPAGDHPLTRLTRSLVCAERASCHPF
jgi:excisionase family DNA binding protein